MTTYKVTRKQEMLNRLHEAIKLSPGMTSDEAGEVIFLQRRTANVYLGALAEKGRVFVQKDLRVRRYFDMQYAIDNKIPARIEPKRKTRSRAKVVAKQAAKAEAENMLIPMLMLVKLWPAPSHEVCR